MSLDSLPGSGTLLGTVIRAPLALIPKRAVVNILRGPLRGKRWVVGSGIHRIWLGSYEPFKMAAAATLVKPGGLVLDIGANVGVYTLLFSDVVGVDGRVIAIEPNPRNVAYLRRHLELNAVRNVSILDGAAGARSGSVSFDATDCPSTGRVDASGTLVVHCLTVDEIVAGAGRPATLLKIDVEGGELDVLKGAEATLRQQRPVVLLATHSLVLRRDCSQFLRSLDFDVDPIDGASDPDELLARPARHVAR